MVSQDHVGKIHDAGLFNLIGVSLHLSRSLGFDVFKLLNFVNWWRMNKGT